MFPIVQVPRQVLRNSVVTHLKVSDMKPKCPGTMEFLKETLAYSAEAEVNICEGYVFVDLSIILTSVHYWFSEFTKHNTQLKVVMLIRPLIKAAQRITRNTSNSKHLP